MSVWILSPVEIHVPLLPGASINAPYSQSEWRMAKVIEVRKLRSTLVCAGEARPIYAVLHAGGGSVIAAVFVGCEQPEWSTDGVQ